MSSKIITLFEKHHKTIFKVYGCVIASSIVYNVNEQIQNKIHFHKWSGTKYTRNQLIRDVYIGTEDGICYGLVSPIYAIGMIAALPSFIKSKIDT